MDSGTLGTILGSVLGFLASVLSELLCKGRTSREPEGVIAGSTGPSTVMAANEDPSRYAERRIPYVGLDLLRASVRPLVTYVFVASFLILKFTALSHGLHVDRVPVVELLPVVWNDAAEALFATILSFWFGSRALARFRR